MSKSYTAIKEIARQAMPKLVERLAFPMAVHRDYADDCHYLGDIVKVRKPPMLTATEFDASQGVSYDALGPVLVDVKLDTIATVDVAAEAVEMAVSAEDLDRAFIEPAAAALAEKINADGLKLYADIANFVGKAGTTPGTLEDLAAVRKAMNLNRVPALGRTAVWDPEADTAFATVPAIVNAEKSGTTAALREGAIGRVFGIDNYMAPNVQAHASGLTAATGVKVNGAAAKGATSINLDGTTLTGKLVKGDLMKIGGVCYVVTADSANAASNAIGGVQIYPALKEQIADNADVEVIGSHTANLAFHPMAFAFVTRPLINPDGEGVASYVTNYNGISLRVTKGYDQKYKRSTYSMDVLYGFKTVYPELAVRVLG